MVAAWALGKVLESYWSQMPLEPHLIGKVTLAIVFLILLRFLLSYGRAVLQESIGCEVAAEERIRLGDILKRVSLGYFAQNSIGDIFSGINDRTVRPRA